MKNVENPNFSTLREYRSKAKRGLNEFCRFNSLKKTEDAEGLVTYYLILADWKYADQSIDSLRWAVGKTVQAACRYKATPLYKDPIYYLKTSEDKEAVDKLLEKANLTIRQREVIDGLYYLGDSVTDLAEKYNVSYQAIQNSHGLALKKLRGVVDETLFEV